MKKLVQNAKGFTLVELMIVVAIIGILAAIAIPQFAAYRIRGFNASALSDTKNLQTAEAAYFADNQLYAITGVSTALATPATGTLLTGPLAAANSIISQWVGGQNTPLQITVGNQVSLAANNNATGTAYNAVGKHFQGDTTYAVDSDVTLVYQNAAIVGRDVAITVATNIAAVANADEFTGVGQWVSK